MRAIKEGHCDAENSGELLKLIEFHGAKRDGHTLKLVHHIALDDSDFPIDDIEKNSLYDVISLSKSLKRIKE